MFSDVLFPFCICNTPIGDPLTTEFGENFWVPINQAISNDTRPGDRIEYIPKVLQALRDGTLEQLQGFYHEQIVR